jgi:hypothetical protein
VTKLFEVGIKCGFEVHIWHRAGSRFSVIQRKKGGTFDVVAATLEELKETPNAPIVASGLGTVEAAKKLADEMMGWE